MGLQGNNRSTEIIVAHTEVKIKNDPQLYNIHNELFYYTIVLLAIKLSIHIKFYKFYQGRNV